jgi:hypothetical protein
MLPALLLKSASAQRRSSAAAVAKERVSTVGCVAEAAREAEKRIVTSAVLALG